jgi:hypothetical protein
MKKILLSATLLGTAFGAQAQEIFKANFEPTTYSLGSFITGPSGTAGTAYTTQSTFTGLTYVTSTDMAASRYQIETDASTNATQVLRMTGWAIAPSTSTPAPVAKSNMLYNTASFNPKWVSRTAGNDVLELDFDLWIPAATTSSNFLQIKLSSSNQYATLINYTPSTNNLSAFNYTSMNATSAVPGGTITTLPRSSWQHVTVTYNPTNGKMRYKLGSLEVAESTTGNTPTPGFLEILVRSGNATTADTPAADFKIDNIVIKATPASSLGVKEIYRENNDIAVYLNQNQLEVAAKIAVKTLEIYNLAGQLVASANGNSVDVSALGAGTYVAKYSDNKNTYSKRFVK